MIGNWIYYGIVLALSCLFAYLHSDRISYTTMYAVLTLPLLSWTIAFISKRFLKVKQSIDSDFALKGDEITYSVELNNLKMFSYSHLKLVFNENHKNNGRIHSAIQNGIFKISAGCRRRTDFKIKCLYRGMFEIGADYVEFMDMLGLFKYKCHVKDKITAMVYPRVIEINDFPFPFIKMSKSPLNFNMTEEDYTNISDIRKYQDSDSYRKIHWKLSAKTGGLMVKNYQTSVRNNAVMFLDLKEVPVDIEDMLIESVISVIDYCLKKKISVELHYFDNAYEVLEERSASGFSNMYSACANMRFNSKAELYGLFKNYMSKSMDCTNIVIFTSDIGCDLAGDIIEASKFGHNIVLFYITNDKDVGLLESIVSGGVFCFTDSALTEFS